MATLQTVAIRACAPSIIATMSAVISALRIICSPRDITKIRLSVTYDEEFSPDMLRFFKDDVADGKDVFSFNVTYQGHGPYNTDRLDWGDPVWDGDVSEYSYYVINNYLGSV